MTDMYCSPLDLVAHDSRAKLISELAGNDYDVLPPPDVVVAYFNDDNVDDQYYDALDKIKARIEQAIKLASGDIDGYLALMSDVKPMLPADSLTACCIDMAMYRLFGDKALDKDSVVWQLNDRRHTFFNNILSGKTVINRDLTPDNAAVTTADPMVFTADNLEGY